MAKVDPSLEEQMPDIPQRQRKPDVHQHDEADYLGRRIEISKWALGSGFVAAYGRPLAAPLKPDANCSDNTRLAACHILRRSGKEGVPLQSLPVRRGGAFNARLKLSYNKLTTNVPAENQQMVQCPTGVAGRRGYPRSGDW
jgi:hypothetical protein